MDSSSKTEQISAWGTFTIRLKLFVMYIQINKVQIFYVLLDNDATLMRIHSHRETTNCKQRLFKMRPKTFGPVTKLSLNDEFLITLMKLRLASLLQIFLFLWIRGTAEYFKAFVVHARYRNILATTPKRNRNFEKVLGKINYPETFAKTP